MSIGRAARKAAVKTYGFGEISIARWNQLIDFVYKLIKK